MGRPKKLTDADVLRAIHECTSFEIVAIPPTIEALKTHLGISSTRTIHRYLVDLQRRGKIKRAQGKIFWAEEDET